MKPSASQRGFLLPAVIFLIVILAGLAAYAVNISTAQQSNAVQDIQGARAYHIAKSGAEWAAYQIMQSSPTATPPNVDLPTCPADSTLAFDGFAVSVSCRSSATYFEQGSDHAIILYEITSTAKYGTANTSGYIERQVLVTLSKCRGGDATIPYQCS